MYKAIKEFFFIYSFFHSFFLLLPGFIVAYFWKKKIKIPLFYFPILAFSFSSLIGYFSFWCYWLSPEIGSFYSKGINLISIILFIIIIIYDRNNLRKILFSKDFIYPVGIMFLVGVFYLSIVFTVDVKFFNLDTLAEFRFLDLPGDNIIPKIVANKLYFGEDLKKPIMLEWLSSDRPPLQSGIVLMQYDISIYLEKLNFYLKSSFPMSMPLKEFAKNANISMSYQVISTYIQCSWVLALWALAGTINLSKIQISRLYFFTIFSGFFLLNSVFVWPKFLAGSFGIFAISILISNISKKKLLSNNEIIIIIFLVSLAWLSHGASIFVVPSIVILILHPKNFKILPKFILFSIVLFIIFILPWMLYQKYFNPPGDRLLKMHLAGIPDVDPRPALKAIIDAYSNLSANQIIKNKISNIVYIVNLKFPDSILDLRAMDFRFIVVGLGVLNISWFIIILHYLFQNFKRSKLFESGLLILSLALMSHLFTSIILFGPEATTIHQSSYCTVILFFIGLIVILDYLPGYLITFLVLFQIIYFTFVWILFPTPSLTGKIYNYNQSIIFSGAISFFVLAWLLHIKLERRR